jgi:LAS superfamily LD-carboxypeptidase LdcB
MGFSYNKLLKLKMLQSIFLGFILGLSVLFMNSCSSSATPVNKTESDTSANEIVDNKNPGVNNSNNSIALKDMLTGRFDYTKESDFVLVNSKYCSRTSYMQNEAYNKFIEMCKLAEKDGISLKIISGTRNFKEQVGIWNRKWEKFILQKKDSLETMKTILTYSSMPSTSRHHWGTDIDINSLENSYFESGKGLKEYNWLCENASKFGFCQVYTSKKNSNRTGYEMEKWHWSYLPVASKNLENFNKLIKYSDIKGFKGSNLAPKVKSIENYVNGIDNKCLSH